MKIRLKDSYCHVRMNLNAIIFTFTGKIQCDTIHSNEI